MTTLEKAIKTYGMDMQLTVAVEELSELIKEICKISVEEITSTASPRRWRTAT